MASRDTDLQAIVNAQCARDCVTWINDWVWTSDPRKRPSALPFLLWPRQEEYIRWRDAMYQKSFIEAQRGITEKTRDVGLTWLNVAWQVHALLYTDGFKGGFGSRKLDLVDKNSDPDTIFEKARYILRMLPPWMLPKGFDLDKHAPFLRIINPDNGSIITGEGGDEIGRGGRSSVYDLDESAFIERPQKVEAALSQNTDCLFETSTPNGPDNGFAIRRHGGNIPVFTFHWRDDPRKTQEWYDRQKQMLDPVTLAQEVDIDYNASRESVTISKAWVDDAIARPLYEAQRGAIVIGGDIATYGKDKSSYGVREGLNILDIAEWHGNDPVESGDRFIEAGKRYEQQLNDRERLYFAIDGNGVGAGTVAYVRRWAQENSRKQWSVIDVQAAAKSDDPRCFRKRDELWWKTREWLRDSLPAINEQIPRDIKDKLGTELASPGYKVGPNGEIHIESKEDMKKRGVASPNLADALIHTMAINTLKPKPEDESPYSRRNEKKKPVTYPGLGR